MSDVVPLLKFTPSAQEPELLETITVQREPLIARLVDSALDVDGGLRHHLLVGPRGIGKTHLLSLIANRVRAASTKDGSRVLVAWLEEDPWTVRTYDKFLAAIIACVAAETRDPELAQRATEVRSRAEGPSGIQGEDLLRRGAGERRVVLLVENLDEIFRRIGSEGQARFRAFVEDWDQLLILATTPQLFAGVRRHAAPFYGFFAVTHLDELTLTSAVQLLKRIARLRGDSALLGFLATDTASQRLTAIEALAGGHPRIWLLLAGCVSIAAIDELVPLFLEALDDLTPYYQDRLRELNDQQQELVVLLSEAGGALSNRALSERSGIAQNQVATLLRQLTDRGYVRRATLPDDLTSGDRRMSFWELREPLMRLCLDVKQARGEPLRIVVEFLRAWYGPRLLDELGRLPPTAELAAAYASEAFRTLELGPDDLLEGSAEEIVARAERGLALRPDSAQLTLAKATGLQRAGRYSEACELIEPLAAVEQPAIVRTVARLRIAALKRQLGEPIDADGLVSDALELRRTDPDDPFIAGLLGDALFVGNRYEKALEAYARACELDPTNAGLHDARGYLLSALGRDEDALEAYARACELDPTDALLQNNRAFELAQLGRYAEALEASEQACALSPGSSVVHHRRGVALGRLGRYEEALAAHERASELDAGDALLQSNRGHALARLGRDGEALEAFALAAGLDPRNPVNHNLRARILRDHGRLIEAEEAARRAVELDDGDAVNRFTLAEVVLTSGDAEQALLLLHDALELWRARHGTPPGDTELLCRILWERYRGDPRRRRLIAEIIVAYDEFGGIEELGRGLVASAALFVDDAVSQHDADAWVEDWARTPHLAMSIPRRLLDAALSWKRSRDRAPLLALPPEQREILIGLLTSK